MNGICEVFERTEKKYVVTREQHASLVRGIEKHMQVDEFGKSQITSLYFDTPARDLIDRSLEKPLYKEKFRIRQYGSDESEQAQVFIEIKKKFKGVVYKRRVMCSRAAAFAWLGGMDYEMACRVHPLVSEALNQESISAQSLQIAREIDAFVARHANMRPSMLISCNRTAFKPIEQESWSMSLPNLPETQDHSDLRITVDEDLKSKDLFCKHAKVDDIVSHNLVVMEIKSAHSMPLWLTNLLSNVGAYPTSFSKYGAAYLNAHTSYDKNERMVACA